MYDNISTSIQRHKIKFNKYFENLLSSYLSKNELSKAMLYGTSNGGKRIRPYLTSIFSNVVNLPKNNYYKLKNAKNLEHITNIFFNQRRKMIKKPLKFLFKNYEKIAEELNLDLNLRPQNLSSLTYYKICSCYERLL